VSAPRPPRLVSCYFGSKGDAWHRMAEVLRYTAEKRCSHWDRVIDVIGPATCVSAIGAYQHAANAHKQWYWAKAVDEAPDDTRMLLIDADTAILRPLDTVWEYGFELAYTIRIGSRFPLNGGVVFLRVNKRTRDFMRRWAERTSENLADPNARNTWRRDYGGVAQAALVTLLNQRDHGLNLHKLRCVEWNCEDSAWATFQPLVTRVLHVKSALRHAVFGTKQIHIPAVKRLAANWRAIEAESRRAAQVSV
jgi:hypothetical protein